MYNAVQVTGACLSVCVCVCVCVSVCECECECVGGGWGGVVVVVGWGTEFSDSFHFFVTNEDINLYNDMGMTRRM